MNNVVNRAFMAKNKLFTLFIALLASLGTISAEIIEHVQIGDLYYNLDTEKQTASVRNEEDYSWDNYQTIQSLVIPSSVTYNTVEYSVTKIEDGSFWGSINLTSISIPSSVTEIGTQLFPDCDQLTSIVVDAENPVYDSRDNCNAIIETATNKLVAGCKNTVIPNTVTEIGHFAFYWCYGLTSIQIPNSVTTLGYCCFENCTSLEEIYIPSSVTNIPGDNVFAYCSALNSIVVDAENPVFDSRNNCNAIIETATNTLKTGCNSTIIPNTVVKIDIYAFVNLDGLTHITIPNSVQYIEGATFDGCSNLKSVTLSNNITYIGSWAFWDCYALEAITIPINMESISKGTWSGCNNVTSLTIPKNIKNIEGHAFSYCTGLTNITCEALTPPTLGEEVFKEVDKSIPLYVPTGSIELYKAAEGWKDFTNIIGIGETETKETNINVVYLDKAEAELHSEQLTFNVPVAPVIEGFTFLRWDVVAGTLADGIYLQAVYTADEPTSAPAVVTNPSNPAQKLIRNGNVYILTDSKTYTVTGQQVR